MSRAKAGKKHRQKDAVAARQTAAASDDATHKAKAIGGDATRRAATHAIPEKDRRPGVESVDLTKLGNVPANETPPPHVLDPEGWAKRTTERQERTKEAVRKRNAAFAEQEASTPRRAAASTAPILRAPRTSRDEAIQQGEPYDNSQPGDFRDSSQKDGKAPEERYINAAKGKVGEQPIVAGGKTAQQAEDLPEAADEEAEEEAAEEE